MEREIKFNVGDKVVHLRMDYFDNQFHFDKCISVMTVTDADERNFSLFGKHDPMCYGVDQWDIRRQSTGLPMYGNERVYHLEKDREEIDRIISTAIQTYDNKCKQNDADRIEQLKNIIANSRKEIEMIKSGNGSWKSGFGTFNNKDYKKKVLDTIYKKVPELNPTLLTTNN